MLVDKDGDVWAHDGSGWVCLTAAAYGLPWAEMVAACGPFRVYSPLTDDGVVSPGGGASPSAVAVSAHAAPSSPDIEKPRCPQCGSTRWVSVSLDEGWTRRAQCVPCGAYHKPMIGPGYKSKQFGDPEHDHPAYRDPQNDGGAAAPPAASPGVPAPAAAERATTTAAPPSDGAGAPPATAGSPPSTSRGDEPTGPVTPIRQPRVFDLYRHRDVTGKSGTGVVACGVEWPDSTAALRWMTEHQTTVHWDEGVAGILAVHGHDGATELRWLSGGE